MPNKMLIDASHPEETRVVVLRGNRVEEFDFEAASKKQLRGNIYLAKVTRVEPSLQAAFVDYGGNRHGFLAFSEIHPDYYQIPVVDRQALIEEEAKAQRDQDDDEAGQRRSRRYRRGDRDGRRAEKRTGGGETLSESGNGGSDEESPRDREGQGGLDGPAEYPEPDEAEMSATGSPQERDSWEAPDRSAGTPQEDAEFAGDEVTGAQGDEPFAGDGATFDEGGAPLETASEGPAEDQENGDERAYASGEPAGDREPVGDREPSGDRDPAVDRDPAGDAEPRSRDREPASDDAEDEDEHVEQLGGDAMEDIPARPQRYRKQYKIQEVIKRRQVLLVQVVKEERGNKGAALTTYLSLAGRYSVLMPNTARGGGISRKITDSTDRQRLKSIAQELEVPEGMGVILRTAGASRSKPEVKRDFEYLLRMWETVRETTLKSTAPMLVYEEGSLIKRAIRDLYNKDIDDIVVAGDKGFREARDFMRLLMPSHVRSVQAYRDPQPIFAKSGVETQLDAMFVNQVTLKSGGYIVINQTEALVAIDVNSGRSTREHNIEDTALRTNLEAADEITRQLRLRDLAGLIVIDFIDMEEGRNNRAVERRLKDALKNDRARIQVGRISHFGLLEMSRQRIRTGVLEGSTEICPHCSGSGMLRSTASIALHVLRVVEDALIKSASHDLLVRTRAPVALYILNEKRGHLRDLERRFGVCVTIGADDSLIGGAYHALERGEPASGGHEPLAHAPGEPSLLETDDFADSAAPELEDIQDSDAAANAPVRMEAGRDEDFNDDNGERRDGESESEADNRRRRRRRRRRGRGGDREGSGIAANAPQPPDDALEVMARIGQLQPVVATHHVSSDAPSANDVDFEADSGGQTAETPTEPVEPVLLVAEAEEAPAKSSERRRPRRAAKTRDSAQDPAADPATPDEEAEQAPELALEVTQGPAEADADGEAVAAPRRSRRAPRARAPRRASPGSDAETATLEASQAEPSVDAAPVPEADSAREPVLDLESGQDAPQTESKPHHQEPARPKRSGWWQRAKASLGG